MADPIRRPQRLGLPRLTDGRPLAFRRAHFLDGTQKVFYGPSQPPDSGVQFGFIVAGEPIDKVYTPPLRWPAAGTLLRIPQVVFLSPRLLPGGSLIRTISFFYTDSGRPASITRRFFLDDVGQAEYDRLVDIFNQAKVTIEGLRPNRTWVDIPDWGEEGGSGPVFGMTDTVDFLLAPPLRPDNLPYLGTDFLHVSCGPTAANLDTIPTSFDIYAPTDDGSIPEELQDVWSLSADRVADAHARFAGFATWVYGYRYQGEGIDFLTQVDAPGVTELPVYLDGPGTPVTTPGDAVFTAGFVADLTALNGVQDNNAAIMQAMCDPLTASGVSFRGASQTLDATPLATMIAAHFGFNPRTGRDLA